jgi:hypothetical protein
LKALLFSCFGILSAAKMRQPFRKTRRINNSRAATLRVGNALITRVAMCPMS